MLLLIMTSCAKFRAFALILGVSNLILGISTCHLNAILSENDKITKEKLSNDKYKKMFKYKGSVREGVN